MAHGLPSRMSGLQRQSSSKFLHHLTPSEVLPHDAWHGAGGRSLEPSCSQG